MNTAEKLAAIAENQKKVYEAGRQDEWSDFWDIYQSNGSRTNYQFGFCGFGWNNYTFKPKYDIKPQGSCIYTFRSATITDLRKLLNKSGVILDLYKAYDLTDLFSHSSVTVLPTIDSRGVNSPANGNRIFYNCTMLKTIEKFIFTADNRTTYTDAFYNCTSLENVVFEGMVCKSMNFSYSPLSIESMKSVISCLKDYSGTVSEGTYTLTLKDECKSALEAEGATSPHGNLWTEYVSELGWVLA